MYVILCICQSASTSTSHTESSSVLLCLLRILAVVPDTTHIPISIIPGALFVCACKCTGIVFADVTAHRRDAARCSDSRCRDAIC